MFRTFSTQEAAELIGIDRHLMPVLHECGLLLGIKTGRGRRYSEEELRTFWNDNAGADLSNAGNIRLAAVIARQRKKPR